MKELRLSNINLQAPYQVKQNPHASNSYVFKTDSGLEFIISLQENVDIIPSGAYEFGINNPQHRQYHSFLILSNITIRASRGGSP